MRIITTIAAFVFTLAPLAFADDHTEGITLNPPDKLEWKDGPPSLPKGAKIAVLEGDPSKEGPFVFRVKAPDGYRIPPHAHPKMERVTILSGTFNIGMGEKFDQKATKAMSAGTYGFWEPHMAHFVWIKGETVAQFHGIGPWQIKYVNPADDPRNATSRPADDARNAASRRTIEFTDDSLATVKKNIAEGVAVLVDVRSEDEWKQGHLDGSIFVPVDSLRKPSLAPEKLEKTLPPKSEKKILYTFCVVGMRAKQAALILENQGYTVRALKPGYAELVKAGFRPADE